MASHLDGEHSEIQLFTSPTIFINENNLNYAEIIEITLFRIDILPMLIELIKYKQKITTIRENMCSHRGKELKLDNKGIIIL